MERICVKGLMRLADENDDSYKEALNSETELHIPKRSLEVVLVGLPEAPPDEIKKQIDVKN
jgi:hypothetical protein